MAKKLLFPFFALLLVAATAVAQAAKPKLAVFVVGVDDWKRGDVLAHIVGEELNRDKSYQVVTRSGAVQVTLKKLRRAAPKCLDTYDLRTWGLQHGVEHICLITTSDDQNFSARLLVDSTCQMLCSTSSVSGGLSAVALKELAWSLTLGLSSGCSDICDVPCMVYVRGGTFRMGCDGGRDGGISGVSSGSNGVCAANEEPDRDVTVGNFWIGKYEVTQAQWYKFMGTTIDDQRKKAGNSSTYGVGANYPIYFVTWYEAKAFCDTLSARTGRTYRLATEEEWEYAARGGKYSKRYKYSGSNSANAVAWYSSTADGRSHAVGTTPTKENELGICDMSGNVFEWCENNGEVLRGGGWLYSYNTQRIANRSTSSPDTRTGNMGFRVV
jgi:formylglycine-generating enzyme required for sulfatase activity